MHIKLRGPKHATIVAYVALFFAMSGTAVAATGGTLILGHSNAAGTTTSLTNTGSGAALHLVTKAKTTPPLAVSNSTKVANLNADMVDGVRASSLQPRLPSRLSFTPLTLINGWDNCGFGAPGIAVDPSGVVHLRGNVCDGNSLTDPFLIPAQFRPSWNEFIPIDLCNSATGRLDIFTNGETQIEADAEEPSNSPQCWTSLTGVTYALPY